MNTSAQTSLKIAQDQLLAAQKVLQALAQDEADAHRINNERTTKAKNDAKRVALIDKLRDADTAGLLTFSDDDVPKVTFMVGDREVQVYIEEKINFKSFRQAHTGVFHYTIDDDCTGYKIRRYKNVATLLTRVAEFQEMAVVQIENKKKKDDLVLNTVDLLESQHPNATITVIPPSQWNSEGSKYYTIYQVKTSKGTVSYTSSLEKGVVKLGLFSFNVANSIKQEVVDMILSA